MAEVKLRVYPDPSSLVVVSNRGPVTFQESPEGIRATRSVGGLVAAVEPIIRETGGVWVAWGGRLERDTEVEGSLFANTARLPWPENHPRYYFSELKLKPEEVSGFYEGFSNACLWPLCHSFLETTVFDPRQWEAYVSANQKFAAAAWEAAGPWQLIWVHDYHLALVPAILRQRHSRVRVSLFWHIPFPPADIFQTLPWAEEILEGMLGSELIAFHTEQYVNNFLAAVERLTACRVNWAAGSVECQGREVRVRAVPIGIAWREFAQLARQERVQKRAQEIRQAAGGEWILLGVDRLDYTKGILERLKAIEMLLERFPAWRRRLTFIQIAVPSRTAVPGYQRLKREVEEAVGRINGKYTEDYHVPVKYIFRGLSREELVAHYLAADMMLVTPLRDGLNLVAKEYVASRVDGDGVLLLSPLAGAAAQLKEALYANPYNLLEMVEQIVRGVSMSAAERRRRMAFLQKRVQEEDLGWWWRQILRMWVGGNYRGRLEIVLPAEEEAANWVYSIPV